MKKLVFNHPFNKDKIKSRLLEDYDIHNGKLVIGVDFDNTIYDTHNVGGDFSCVIDLVKECINMDMIICLYTSSQTYEDIERKIDIFKDIFGKEPDYVNMSPLSMGADKPFFNILLDDRAGLEESWEVLYEVIQEKTKKKCDKKDCIYNENCKCLKWESDVFIELCNEEKISYQPRII
jgi:hypothetical protein